MRPKIVTITPEFLPISTHGKFINIINKRFGRITIAGYVGNFKWFCVCDCGKKFVANSGHIRNGNTQSCGCLHNDTIKEVFTKHGEASKGKTLTPEYRSYCLAKSRCINTTDASFYNYGGRGIKFIFDSYKSFLKELGRKPTPKHSLDRINVNGNYEIGNVRWATWIEQARNRRNEKLITIDGVTKCQAEWAIEYNTTDKSIDKRRRRKWCDKCSVTNPKNITCIHK